MVALVTHNELTPAADFSRYRLGMLVALASVVMLFTSLTSAYVVRAAVTNDWTPLPVPRAVWLSTTFILLSSATLEFAKRALKNQANDSYRRWIASTAGLGVAFLISQLFVWRQLAAQGVYIATNPHGSFFYLLSATHGVHLAGGLLVLFYLLIRYHNRASGILVAKQIAATGAVALYWHFMDALWLYLLVLLFAWR